MNSLSSLSAETHRLFHSLKNFEYTVEDCEILAPITQEINQLKKQENALILAHSYQTPDILYGVADHIGDSYGLSRIAQETTADIILFSSVLFMGETAKILNPTKTVRIPSVQGCSLADSITPIDVQELRKKYPDAMVVAYINTSAAVKAEVDACCTSSNAHKVVEAMDSDRVIFLPDILMGRNLQKRTSKELILFDGKCIVHEEFTTQELAEVREESPNAEILVHPECDPEILKGSDFVGSTEQLLLHMQKSDAQEFMLVTECGLTDRAQQEYPEKKIVGTCHLCPYMKNIQIKEILTALKNPTSDQEIMLPPDTLSRAKKSLEEMFLREKMYDATHQNVSAGWG